jgi:hypothetical protein
VRPRSLTLRSKIAADRLYERCRGALAEAPVQRPSPETEDLIGRIRAQSQAAQIGSVETRSGQAPFIRLSEAREPAVVTPRLPDRREPTALRLRILPMRTIEEDRDDGLVGCFRPLKLIPKEFAVFPVECPGVPSDGRRRAAAMACALDK